MMKQDQYLSSNSFSFSTIVHQTIIIILLKMLINLLLFFSLKFERYVNL